MKRVRVIRAAAACAIVCLASCGNRNADKPRAQRPVTSPASDQPGLLATVPDGASPPARPATSRLGLHTAFSPAGPEFVFAERGGGVAFVVERGGKFQVVHNGLAGRPYAAVGQPAVSADGRRCAHGALVDGKWRMVVDGKEGQPFGTVRSPVFSPDGAHVAYQAMEGEMWHLVVDGKVDRGTRTRFLTHEFAAGGSRIVFIDDADDRGTGRLVVSDLGFERQTVVATGVARMVLGADGSRVAAVVAGEVQRVLDFRAEAPDRVEKGPAFQAVLDVGFGPDGVSLAYVGHRFGRSYVVLDGAETQASTGEIVGRLAIRPDGKAVGVFVVEGGPVRMRELPAGKGEEAAYDEAEGLTYGEDGRSHAYAARRGGAWFVVANGKEGPPFDRVVTPSWSPDGRFLAYRARREGRRFVVVADANGATIRQHPAYEQVFPVGFTAGGKAVAYGVKDGPQLLWKVEPL